MLGKCGQGVQAEEMSFKDQFPDWEDFPNDLRVLVVENGDEVAAIVGKLLEECGFHGELNPHFKNHSCLPVVQLIGEFRGMQVLIMVGH